MDPNKYLLEFY